MITAPRLRAYDVVIVGGAVMGSSVAWWLSRDPDFDGSVLVVERDPSYERSSTAATNSCVRQQFSNELNVRISQFTVDYVRTFRSWFDDPDVAEIATDFFGYLFLADTEALAATLRANQAMQSSWGAGTRVLSPDELAETFPFLALDDIVCGSHNPVDEGYFDGGTMFQTWRDQARRNGVEYCRDEVVAIAHDHGRVRSVTLASGETVACGTVVNAAGPRASAVAAMVGFVLPVEPRKRFSFVFAAAEPLDRPLPLTIDPSGVHCRSDGGYYQAGCPPDDDRAVDPADHGGDPDVWEDKIWPALARRIPAFERIKVINKWVGHYAYNTLDRNAVVGPAEAVPNFYFCNGFSGHGLQQSPGVGRALSELLTYGEYRTIDLSAMGHGRIMRGEPFLEKAII